VVRSCADPTNLLLLTYQNAAPNAAAAASLESDFVGAQPLSSSFLDSFLFPSRSLSASDEVLPPELEEARRRKLQQAEEMYSSPGASAAT